MKRRLSLFLAIVMVLSMFPVAAFAAEATELISVTDEAVTADGYTYEYTAETAGTLTVTAGTCSPGYRYKVYGPDYESIYFTKWSSSHDHEITAGTWTVVFYAYTSAQGNVAGTVSFDIAFTPAEGGSEEVQKADYEVSETALALGDNALTLLDTAVTTIYVFEPTETAVYTFTAPEGAILGYWGAGSWFLSDPGSTTNTYEWTCTGVGQTAYIGVSGVEGEFNLNVEKTGEYTVVETPIVAYENKATLETFAVPEGAVLGSYVDVYGDTHTAVLGDDGYYHLDSVDGDVLLIDMDYQEIILSAALKSDRPVMYAYMYDEDGNVEYKYDIGNAVLAYEEVMDANGYYPVTEDILLFYQVYAVQAGTYTFHVTGEYNEECVWMYCMRTMNMDNVVVEPSEPETEATEPETEATVPETEATVPETEATEPVSGTVVLDASATASSSSKYTYKFAPETDGTLTVTVGDGTTNWVSDVYSFATFKAIASSSGTAQGTYTAEVTAGTNYYIRVYASSGSLAATPVKAVFTPAGATEPEVTEPETEATAPETEATVPETEATVPETEATVPETEVTEPETEATTPVIPDEDVPTGTYYSITVDGTTTYYTTFTTATMVSNLKKITGTGYVKLYQDLNLGSNSCLDIYNGTITLDLNGHTISASYSGIGTLYVDGATVTIVDTSADADGAIYNSHTRGHALMVNSGTVTLQSGNVRSEYWGVSVYETDAIFNMEGGYAYGKTYAVNVLNSSSANISGGTLEAAGLSTLVAGANATVYISGGYFNGSVPSGSGLNGRVSGGYYTASLNASRLAEGCEVVANDDSVYKYKVVDPNATEPDPSEPETEPTEPAKDAYAVSTTTLSVGSNTVSTITTAEATIFKFTPAEAGTYTITGPEGSKVGIWGYSTNLTDPNSTSNSCELTLANAGPTVRVGVTGVEGQIVLTITKYEEPTEPSEPETEATEPETEPSEPETEPSEPAESGTLISVTNADVTTSGYVFEYTAASAGTLHVSVGECNPGWRYKVFSPDGIESGYRSKYTAGTECDYHNVAGNWKIVFYAYSSAVADNVEGTVSFTVTFTPDEVTEPSEPETEPSEPETEPTEPETEPSEPADGGSVTVTDASVTTAGYTYEYTAETAGTLNVTVGTCSPGWRYKVFFPDGTESIYRTKYSAGETCDYEGEAGNWKIVFYAYSSAQADNVAGTVSFTVTFTPSEGGDSGEVEKAEYEVSETELVLGDNTVTLLDTAVTTIYVFEPTETGVFTFTAPQGAILGYWGAGSWFLSNPNSTTNTYEWTCTGVGQSAYIGVSGVDGAFTLNVAKTGDYTVVETPIVPYENKATLETFTLPEGATLGDYVDVYGETHTAVLGEDGYYHLDSADGPILLIDMDYMEIILSAALKSDRPVMYAYMYDEDGNVEYKYDIGNAVLAYEAVMDANGYYPVTEDILLFYQVYAVQAGTYTFHVTGDYNEECVWMYCMRTMTLPEPEPTVELTHISLKPGADALGYKAAATNLPEGAHVEISLWVNKNKVITKATTALRLINIMKSNGGETVIYAKATIVDADGNVIAESAEVQTTMKETLETVNDNWASYNDTQKNAVKALVAAYAHKMDGWKLNNILQPQVTVESVTVENQEMSVNGTTETLTLAGAYNFSVQDTEETVQNSPYANWVADYYVSMDAEAGEGLYLAGNYGTYGWIALPVEAGQTYTNVPVLSTLLNTSVTYEEMVTLIGTFTCGVADTLGNNTGATVTVELRLTNPENANEYIVLNSVELTL